MDASTANDIKNLASNNRILSHVGLITMGIIPSIASQGIETSLKKFTSFDPAETDGKLSALSNNVAGDSPPDMDGQARSNIMAGKINAIAKSKVTSVLTGISDVDKSTNQVIDMNSLMLALDDYVKTTRGLLSVCYWLVS